MTTADTDGKRHPARRSTFGWRSRFLPRDVREDLGALSRFIDEAAIAADTSAKAFTVFATQYDEPTTSGTPEAIARAKRVRERRGLEHDWFTELLGALYRDARNATYKTFKDTEAYLSGTGDTIGLMVARTMQLPEASYEHAAHLGRAFRYLDMLRNIGSDAARGRTYLARDLFTKHSLPALSQTEAQLRTKHFATFLRSEVDRATAWQQAGMEGLVYLPQRYRIPVVSTCDAYDYIAKSLAANPLAVFGAKQVAPPKLKMAQFVAKNTLEYGF